MQNNRTELIFILDRSGSMAGLESDTIGGYNGMLAQQKQTPGQVRVTTVLFDDRQELVHDSVDLQQVPPLTSAEYFVRGSTALLDALGSAIGHIAAGQAALPKEERAEKVLFVITTDGLENASREWTYDKVRALVEEHKALNGWEFLFLGANIDAIGAAQKFGISADRAVNYHADHKGTELNFKVLGKAITHVRTKAAPMSAGWKAEIEEDYASRGREF